jgi:hypothetical protein
VVGVVPAPVTSGNTNPFTPSAPSYPSGEHESGGDND